MTEPTDGGEMVVCKKCRLHRRPGNEACPHCGHEPGRRPPPRREREDIPQLMLYGPAPFGMRDAEPPDPPKEPPPMPLYGPPAFALRKQAEPAPAQPASGPPPRPRLDEPSVTLYGPPPFALLERERRRQLVRRAVVGAVAVVALVALWWFMR
jgi:hypothetical protein